MKSKRISFYGNTKQAEETANKNNINGQPSSRRLKAIPETSVNHHDNSKQTNKEEPAINRTNSLSRKDPVTVTVNKASANTFKKFESTYYGQGFLKIQKNNKDSVEQDISMNKTKVCTMHKTATSWNLNMEHKRINKNKVDISSNRCKNISSRDEKALSNNNRKGNIQQLNFLNDHATSSICLPTIEERGRNKNMWQDAEEPGIEDRYINYIAANRKPKGGMSLCKQKDIERGYVPILTEQRLNPNKNRDIRSFNWEGIHFEVSPKRDGSIEEVKEMQAEYTQQLNLMRYNFNGSFTRNSSESPKNGQGDETIRKVQKIRGRGSMKFIKSKERCGTNNTTSTTVTNNEEKCEKTQHKNSGIYEEINGGGDENSSKDINSQEERPLNKPTRPPSPIASKCISKKLKK